MGFEHFAGALENESLRGMESSKIDDASRVLVQTNSEHGGCVFEVLARLIENTAGFRRRRSSPSCRISCMRGERSR